MPHRAGQAHQQSYKPPTLSIRFISCLLPATYMFKLLLFGDETAFGPGEFHILVVVSSREVVVLLLDTPDTTSNTLQNLWLSWKAPMQYQTSTHLSEGFYFILNHKPCI